MDFVEIIKLLKDSGVPGAAIVIAEWQTDSAVIGFNNGRSVPVKDMDDVRRVLDEHRPPTPEEELAERLKNLRELYGGDLVEKVFRKG